jgi:arylsulfatase A-like enzyme
MKIPSFALALLASLFAFAAHAGRAPNIIIFFMDDLGYGDLRVYGATDVATPHLDKLAREGVRLTDCYAAASVCTPTRAAFMTGRYQQRVGLESVLAPSLGNADQGLSPSLPTLPRYLKNAGYATGLVGKWHLGFRPEFHPNKHGFDEFFGFLGGAVDYYSHKGEVGEHDLYENEKPVELPKMTYLTDAITERAVSFVERHRGEPFFLDVAYNATHWPFQPPGLTEMPVHPSGNAIVAWAEKGTREEYVKMLESADAGIGRILATLDRLGLRDDTLVIFTSDNGGEWLSRMDPLFHRKTTLWEGGIRVPCILRWPKKLPAGQVSAQAAITMDLTATILAAAGVRPNAEAPLDGINLVPLLATKGGVLERTFYWRNPRTPERAMRDGRWKFIAHSSNFPGSLFDLQTDPGEHRDLAARRPELLRELAAKHAEWTRSVPAPPK